MTSVFNPGRYQPLRVGNMWVVTELFVTRHRGFVMPQWTVLYWDKDRGLWLIPDWVLTQARRKLLQQESERD